MSRYIIPASTPRYHVVVGWDPPLATFFGEVWDRTVPDEDDETACLLWAGAALGALPTVDALQVCLAAWATIPPEIIAQLQQDCVTTPPRTPLQERMVQMLAPDRAEKEVGMDPMEPYTGTAYASQEPCWRCSTALWRLDPPVPGGWKFYCPACQYLVMTRAAAEHALRNLAGPSIGVLVSWPSRLHVQPLTPKA